MVPYVVKPRVMWDTVVLRNRVRPQYGVLPVPYRQIGAACSAPSRPSENPYLLSGPLGRLAAWTGASGVLRFSVHDLTCCADLDRRLGWERSDTGDVGQSASMAKTGSVPSSVGERGLYR